MRSNLLARLALLLVASSPAAAQEGLAGYPDWLCDTPANLTGSVLVRLWQSQEPSIAWDGSAYGVAWSDTEAGNFEIYYSRVAADGTALVGPSRISTTPNITISPSLVWTGSEYGVAWSNQEAAPNNAEIFFARVSTAGARIGAEVRITGDDDFHSYSPTLTWSGAGYGVAWQDLRSGTAEVYFTRLSAAGAPLQADTLLSVDDAAVSDNPSLAWSGAEYLAVWQDARPGSAGIYARRISSAGVPIGSESAFETETSASGEPSVVWAGSVWAVAWRDVRDVGGGGEVYFARLNPAGAGLLGSEVRISTTSAASQSPSLVWTGAEYGVAWREGSTASESSFARISAGGVKVAETILTSDGLAFVGGDRHLAWGTLGYGHVFDINTPQSIKFVGLGCHADTTPPTCPNGLSYTANSASGVTLVWTQPGDDLQTEIAYHRVYRDGAAVGITTGATFTESPRPAGVLQYTVVAVNARGWESTGCSLVTVPLPEGGCGEDWTGSTLVSQASGGLYPAVIAWTGGVYGVAWADFRNGSWDVFYRSVGAAGVPLTGDATIATGASASQMPSIAWSGAELGIAWYDDRDGNYEIYFNRLSPLGVAAGPDTRVTANASFSANPKLAWSGSEYGVVWNDNRDGNWEVYFRRISAAGVALGVDSRITSSSSYSYADDLAWSGNGYGVTFIDNRDGNDEVFFNRIAPGGFPMGADLRVSPTPAISSWSSLAWSGSEYGVAWHDVRDGNYEIYMNRISAAGALLGADVRVTTSAATSYLPALEWTGAEWSLVWLDNRNGSYDLFGASLDAAGGKLGSDRTLVVSAHTEDNPEIAVGGRGLGVVFDDDEALQTRFLGLGCGPVDTTPPTCPASPAEVARTTVPHSVTLAWGASLEVDSDFSHYRILRDGVLRDVTASLSWTDTTFDPAVGYVYWIEGVNAAGYASPGCATVDTSDTAPPGCPGNLLATNVTPTSVTLVWLPASDGGSGLRQYKVFRNNVFLADVAAGTTSYTDGTLSAGTTYNFAVLAEDWAGNLSPACATASVWISTAPITLYLTKVGDGINAHLDWNDVNLNEYVVYRSVSPQTSSEHERVPVSETNDPVLQDGVQIWFYYIQQRGL